MSKQGFRPKTLSVKEARSGEKEYAYQNAYEKIGNNASTEAFQGVKYEQEQGGVDLLWEEDIDWFHESDIDWWDGTSPLQKRRTGGGTTKLLAPTGFMEEGFI